MEQHHQSFAIGEMAMPLMETPKQQRIMDLEEQLKQEKESHKETKSKLEIAEETIKQNECRLEMLGKVMSSFDNKLEKKNLEYEKIIRQDKFLLEEMKNELSHVVDEHEKRDLDYGELKKKNEEATVKFQTENKWLKERIEELEKTNIKNGKMIQELEEAFRQKECKLEKELSDVKVELEERDLKFDELKKKYEEAVVKMDGMVKIQKAMKDLELNTSQLQQQQQQQLDKVAENNQIPNEDFSYSTELKECVSVYNKWVDAYLNSDYNMRFKLSDDYRRRYHGLSKEDQKKCSEIGNKYYEVSIKK